MDRAGSPAAKKRTNARPKTSPCGRDERLADAKWSKVNDALENVLRKNCSRVSFEETYRNAYSMVRLRQGERLYEGVREIVLARLLTEVRETVLGSLDGGDFLRTLVRCWTDHRTAMVRIRDMLMYVDKVNVRRSVEDSVYNLGLVLFRDIVARHERVRERLRETLLDAVTRERNGQAIDRAALRDACRMLLELGIENRVIYQLDFEMPFLKRSGEYYNAESRRLLAENGAIAYVEKAACRINEEAERARNCLDVSTERSIVQVTGEELISNHVKAIVEMENSGVAYMLKNGRTQDLYFMYTLLSKYPDSLNIMLTYLNKYLREECQLFVKRDDTDLNPVAYVQSLLDFNDKIEYFHRNMFTDDKTFKNAISEFNHFLIFNPKLPRYISLFIDEKLRKAIRVIDENSLEVVLNKAMVLFRHLQDKDVFETYYRQHLAKRILLNKFICEDNEKNIISKLKTECGSQYTSKLEGMFNDISLSNAIMNSFKQCDVPTSYVGSIDLTVRVLTTRFWPLPNVTPKCILPRKPLVAYEEFRTFYLDRHSGRQLRLQPQLGTADICAVFDNNHRDNNATSAINSNESAVGWTSNSGKTVFGYSTDVRKHIFQVSTYQMAILMVFNSYEKMTMEMIMTATDINEKDLIRALQSLVMGKPSQRILLKSPKTKDIELHHEFSVNDLYKSKLYRVRIKSNTTIGENESDRLSTKDNVNEHRKREIEAVILRIMRIRKKCTHSALSMEVIEKLRSRFMPSPVVVKKCIECLIEQNHLVRSELDRFTYSLKEEEHGLIKLHDNVDKSSHYTQLWSLKNVVYGAYPPSSPS